ncbi:hypothetical protein DL764_005175 [Monosporascus ibericus]|uniref:Xylanolytic transcriptional activator regulatory domain-containing protein n=1 Tax=Monosporascus ibericus TaxID=155417 RepID=A0A4Q4TD48_9PEZI|nr:hypothetical protein DL764_005175 [Monosporascus ibericus]
MSRQELLDPVSSASALSTLFPNSGRIHQDKKCVYDNQGSSSREVDFDPSQPIDSLLKSSAKASLSASGLTSDQPAPPPGGEGMGSNESALSWRTQSFDHSNSFAASPQSHNSTCNAQSLLKRIRHLENRLEEFESARITGHGTVQQLQGKPEKDQNQPADGTYHLGADVHIMREYDAYWASPGSSESAFVIQLQLVMAIGSALYDDNFSMRKSAVRWVHEAQAWLVAPRFKSKLNLISLQIMALLCLARQTTGLGGDLVWIQTGSLLRTAFFIGLHRDPDKLPGMTQLKAEMRRRLWSTILELDLQSSIDSGSPPMIPLDQCDIGTAANSDDEHLVDAEGRPVSQSPEEFTDIRYFIALHVPFFAAALTEPAYAFSRKTGVEMALKIYYAARPRAAPVQGSPGFPISPSECSFSGADHYTRLTITGGGVFRYIPHLATVIVALELHSQLQEDITIGLPAARPDLINVLQDSKLWSLQRVEAGDTNAKGYIIAVALCARVDALLQSVRKDDFERHLVDAALEAGRRLVEIFERSAGDIATELYPTDEDQLRPDAAEEEWDAMQGIFYDFTNIDSILGLDTGSEQVPDL